MSYDIAIIGTGPAGMSLALRISEKYKLSIALIETGSFETNPETQKFSSVEATGDLSPEYYPVHAQRVVGGTSVVWNGYCAPLDKRGFDLGLWPISYDEINGYYPDAAQILDISTDVMTGHRSIGDSPWISYSTFYLSTPVRFGQKYKKRLESDSNIHLLAQKTCTKILTRNNQVVGLELTDTNKKTTQSVITAKAYVAACGGIGNPRLLHLSNIGKNLPIGNFFMEHPHIFKEGTVEIKKSVLDELLLTVKSDRVSHSLHLSNDYCLKNNLLSFSVGFDTDNVERKIFMGEKQEMYVSKTKIRAEMLPMEKNIVALSNKKHDPLGQPLAKINFVFDFEEKAKDCWTRLSHEMLRGGIGRATVAPGKFKKITGGGHYMGSTRMGTSPNSSVVDQNCKVHGIDNLYVGGSSVFPVSGAANPTLSIVALALRTADHIGKKIQEQS